MSDLLVIDPSALCRELLGRTLEAQGFDAAWAGPEEAHEVLRQTKPVLLILEPGPAGSEGWRLLATLHRARQQGDNLQIVILSEASDKSDVMRAAELGVRGYMLKKQFSMPELLTRVRRHVAPSRAPIRQPTGIGAIPAKTLPSLAPVAPNPATPAAAAASVGVTGASGATNTTIAPTTSGAAMPTPGGHASASSGVPLAPPAAPSPSATADQDRAAILEVAHQEKMPLLAREQSLGRLEQAPLKTLPGVVAELVAVVSSPRGSMGDVAQLLRRDPVLTARVLRVANSAAFASERARIATVEDAVKNIGVSSVRNLVLNVGVFDAFAVSASDGMRVMRVWQHCLGVAMLMEKLAPQDQSVPPGSAYLVGLCHDLAEIVLRQHFAAEYELVTSLVSRTGRPLRQAEAVVFGLPYGEMVQQLLTRLRLPPLITLPIEEFFERGDRKTASGAGSLLGRALRATNVYAHGLMLAPGLDEPVTPLTRAECRNTFGEAGLAAVDDELLRGEAMSTANVLGGLSGHQMQQSCEPLLPMQPLRACYIRHPDFGEMDPLASLLRLAVREVQLLPNAGAARPESLEGAGALIMAGPRSGGADALAREIDQVRRLLAGRPIPVLYLGGNGADTPPADLPTLVIRRLPITIGAIGAFLASAAAAADAGRMAA